MTQTTATKRGLLRRLYDWTMANATGRHAWAALFAISFAESSFFPIAPDVMLMPMVLADRKRAFLLAAWCTLASVLGGMLGYAIGALLYDSVGQWVIRAYGYGNKIEEFRSFYAEWGAWVILIKGALPIPYKLITILSGFAGYNFPMFVVLSAITRGFRFGAEAALLYRFGPPIQEFIEKRLEFAMLLIVGTIIGGFILAKYVI
ncbi:MAG TPA: YqaA family protein [Micropepsaceae bacterium]|jgi:membrane protein YqaA with SNARE-associated domain|nr:YqaA family protein [Micropepsaceae bacterium]